LRIGAVVSQISTRLLAYHLSLVKMAAITDTKGSLFTLPWQLTQTKAKQAYRQLSAISAARLSGVILYVPSWAPVPWATFTWRVTHVLSAR
jgi:hypothetical protein